MDSIKEKLESEIDAVLDQLFEMEEDTKEYTTAAANLARLNSMLLEIKKNESEINLRTTSESENQKLRNEELELKQKEFEFKVNQAEQEAELKQKELEAATKEQKSQKIGRYIGYALSALGIIVPICAYGHWMKRGYKFEETGTISSKTFRDTISLLKPFKK